MAKQIVLCAAIILALFSFPLISAAQDRDGDGMPDAWELAHPCLNPDVPDGNLDPDGDDLTSLAEYLYSPLMDPCSKQSDGDGVNDGAEVAGGSNPLDSKVAPGATVIAPATRVTAALQNSLRPRLAWTGVEFGAAWYDSRDGNEEIYFARLTTTGAHVAADLRVTSNLNSSTNAELAYLPGMYGLAWVDNRNGNNEIYFTRISSLGLKQGADARVTSNASASQQPALAANGARYGLVWSDNAPGDYELYFAGIGTDGVNITGNLRLTTAALDQTLPAITRYGSGFGLCWTDSRAGNNEIYFNRIDRDGNLTGADARVTANAADSTSCSIAYTGSEFGLAWNDNRDGNYEIYFARVAAATGIKIGADQRITNALQTSDFPRLIWTGAYYQLAWRDQRDGNEEIYFTGISADGIKIKTTRITSTATASQSPDPVWTGSEFDVAYNDNLWGNHEIYFVRVAPDRDGDGLPDGDEIRISTNPADYDTDNDGLPDGWEVQSLACGFNPYFADPPGDYDADSLTNANEYLYSTNPCDPDSDHDTLTDPYEIYTSLTDPNLADTDADAMPDAWETSHACLNPLVPDPAADPDADTLTNLTEYGLGFDPCSSDGDGDGMPDLWESQHGLDPANGGDKILDLDGDGLTNWEEYYYGTLPEDPDSDNDGISDYDELIVTLTDPYATDSDADGMPDGWEYLHGLDPLHDDTAQDADGDGIANLDEYLLMLDPQSYDLDIDRDGLANAVETNTGVYQDLGDTGTDPLDPDTDAGREWDGLEVLVNHSPLNAADDRTWSAGALITTGDIYYTDVVLAQTADNALHAVWQQPAAPGDPELSRTYYSRNAGGTWTAPTLVFANTVDGLDLLAQGNTLHLIYRRAQSNPFTDSLRYRTRNPAGTWSAQSLVTANLDPNSELDLALLPNGNLYAFYGTYTGATATITYSIRDTSTSTWTSTDVQYPHNLADIQQGDFHVKADPLGNLHLIYEDHSLAPSEIFYSKLSYGAAAWTTPLNVSATPWYNSMWPRLAVDPKGNAYFLWNEFAASNTVNYRPYRDGKLGAAVTIGPSNNSSNWKDLATDALGNVYVVIDNLYTGIAPSGPLAELRFAQSYLTRGFQLLPDRNGVKLNLLYYKNLGSYSLEYVTATLDFPDTDTDALNDLQEFLMGGNPNAADSDNDALSDYNELAVYHSDPNNPDSDGDGLTDGAEIARARAFSCAGTSCAASGCTFRTYNGHNYLFCNNSRTWQSARTFCLGYDGDLVSIDSAAENAWIKTYLSAISWIGFNDQTQEGGFIWSNGAANLYTNWDPGEPNDAGGNEDCAQVRNTNGQWNDANCTTSTYYLCEDGVHPSPALYDTDGGGESDGLEAYLNKDPDDPADDYAHGPVTIADGLTSYFSATQLALDGAGKITLLYEFNSYSAPNYIYELRATASTNNGASFSPRSTIYTYSNPMDSPWYILQDAKVLDTDTTIMVVLQAGTTLKSSLYSHGSLGAWTTIATTGPTHDGVMTSAKLSVINANQALLVWTSATDVAASYQLYSALWNRATGWAAPISIATGNSGSISLTFSPFTAPGGQVHLAYANMYDAGGLDRTFLYYRRWTGASWTAPETIHTETAAITWMPSLWVSATGVRHILYNVYPYAELKDHLWYLKYNGSAWEAPVQLAPDVTADFSFGLMSFNLAETQSEVVHTFATGVINGQVQTYRVSRFSKYWTPLIPFLPYPYQVGDFAVGANKVIHLAGRNSAGLFYTSYSYPDTDGDGITDDGEFFNGTSRTLVDTDGDGLTDYQELVTYNTDPTRADTDDDGLSDQAEITAGTNPLLRDSDGDKMPDAWELAYGLNPNNANPNADPDNDGFTNLQEFRSNLNPTVAEPVPASAAAAPAYDNTGAIPLTFTCSNPLASVKLYLSFNGLPYINLAPFGYTKMCYDPPLEFSVEPLFGDGSYRFYTRATLTSLRVETAPASPDAVTIEDTQKPALQSVTDEGAYTSQNNRLGAAAAAADLGPAGIGGFWYAIGTAAYPAAGYNNVLAWKWDADGAVNHLFGATVLAQGSPYYVSMMAQDLAGNTSPPLSSNGITIDTSAPGAVTVTDDGTYSGFTDRMHATWSGGSDPTSGLDHYEYAIGSGVGLTDVVGWTAVGTQTNMTRYGLALNETQLYCVGVKAVNGSGLTTIGWSNGIMVDSNEPVLTASAPAQREIVNDSMPPLSSLSFSLHFSDLGGSGISYGAGNPTVVLDFDPVPGWTRSGDTITFGLWGGHTLGLGNHVVSVQLTDRAGNELTQNVIFTVEDPRRVFINPVAAAWKPGQPNLAFYEDGGFGPYHWTTTAGTLNVVNGHTVSLTPTADPGSYVIAVSDSHLVSAQAEVVIKGLVELAPTVARLAPGDTLWFTASGGTGPYTWQVGTSGSYSVSGDTKRCLYTAGALADQYAVKATDSAARSFTARVIVTASVGRAVIVVGGGLVDSNRQVEALNHLGNFAYETLLSRGFSRDQIYYLNPDPYQNYDGDGDGYLDDFDCAPGATIGCKPSTAHLRYALTDWADTGFGTSNPRVGPGVPLYVYLVDHGGADGFLLNYSSPTTPDVVSAASVDGWLDGVQAGTTVVVVYDACYSGSFMDELGAGGAHRIVVSSAGLNESAYFGVGGLVSFSQFFWQGARQGLSVKGSFDAASLALAAWSGQHPQLDDNGTGAYETEGVKDGAAAATAYLGAAFVPGALVPALAAMGDTVLDGTTHTLLYTGVQNVQSYEVAAVYGLLTPPGYAPPRSSGDYQTPGLDDAAGLPLPRIYLEYNGGSGQWEHTLTVAETAALFPVNGRYTLTLYSQDREGEVSARADVVLTIFGPDPYEVDDAWMEGTTIEVDAANAQAHNAHDALDADWVHFAVLAGGTYKVYTSNLGDRSDTELWLYGPAAGGTNPGPLVAYDDDSGGGPSGRASMVFTHLDVGTYYVKVDQYAGATVFGEGTDYDLRVDRDTLAFGTLDGYITDSATGLGVYGAVVKVALGGTNYVTTTTIAGGYFEMLGNVPPGSGYAFTATKANYDPISPPTTAPQIIAGARSHKNAVLPAKAGTGVLAGTVRDGAVPLGGARLVINFQNLMSDAGGQYAVRVAAGSYSVDCRANGYTNYLAAGIAVTANNTTTYNVAMAAVDTDKDGIRDALETGCLNPNNPDVDGDGLCDGNTQVMNGSTVVCLKGEDMNANGVVDAGETNPCAADSDGDGVNDRLDCGPLNPNTWNTCATCQDTDADGWFGVCNTYAGISGPDCNDTNTNVWNQCGTCADADADGWWTGCNRYQTVLGPDCDDNVATGGPCHNTCTNFYADADADAYGNASAPVSRCAAPAGYVANSGDCNDTNTNVWNTCGTCVDADADGWFVGCNRYLTINGPDCDDNAATGAGCHNTCSNFYQDADADTYGNLSVSLSRCAAPAGYVANSADCLDTNTNVWNTCGTCVDADGDGWFVGCNRYLTINGPDCDDSVATGAGCHNTCSNFYPDSDNDAHGNPGVSLARCAAPVGYVADNTDCSDTNTNAWSKCATCVDADADGWFRDCDRYQTVSGPDCADSDTAVHPGHAEVTCDGKDNDCNPATLDAPDTDRDGLSDCAEPGYGTNPANWDSDGDHLPDGFEVANLSGHSVGEDLDPLNGADGALDFDADGISNVNEYYNNSDLWSPDPHPGVFANPACFYWGDADGDGIPAPSDLIALKLEISGVHQPYRDVLPHTFDTLDLDQDGYAAPSDLILLRLMIAGSERPGGYPSTPNAITVLSAPGAAVAVGSTTHVTVSLQGQGGGHSAGFALVFSLESGSALLVGGDGTDLSGPPGNRYDFTGPSLSLSPSTITLIPLAPGPLTLRASLPTCGAPPLGRWCSPLLSDPIVITAQ